jgi:hypothetical protein
MSAELLYLLKEKRMVVPSVSPTAARTWGGGAGVAGAPSGAGDAALVSSSKAFSPLGLAGRAILRTAQRPVVRSLSRRTSDIFRCSWRQQ